MFYNRDSLFLVLLLRHVLVELLILDGARSVEMKET